MFDNTKPRKTTLEETTIQLIKQITHSLYDWQKNADGSAYTVTMNAVTGKVIADVFRTAASAAQKEPKGITVGKLDPSFAINGHPRATISLPASLMEDQVFQGYLKENQAVLHGNITLLLSKATEQPASIGSGESLTRASNRSFVAGH